MKPSDSAKEVNKVWEKNWEDYRKQPNTQPSKTNSIVIPLFKSFGGLFALSSALRVVNILIQVVSLMKYVCHYKFSGTFAEKKNTVVPGFRALGPSTAKSALNPGSALFPRLDLVHFVP